MKAVLVSLALVIGATGALADARQDCLLDGDADLRIRRCSDLISRDGRDPLAYHKRGNAYRDKGEPNRAIVDYTEAIEINPLYGDAYYNRGGVYQNKGDLDHAIADYSKAIEINPRDEDACYSRGTAYLDKRDYRRAIADFTRAIEINPRSADAYNARGDVYMARFWDYETESNLDRAIVEYTKAIEINPQYADAYFNRGYVYSFKADTDRLGALSQGRVYTPKGEYDRAIADFAKAIKINPKRADAYIHRGVSYEVLGRKAEAIADFRRALAIDPKDAFSSNALKRLGASP